MSTLTSASLPDHRYTLADRRYADPGRRYAGKTSPGSRALPKSASARRDQAVVLAGLAVYAGVGRWKSAGQAQYRAEAGIQGALA